MRTILIVADILAVGLAIWIAYVFLSQKVVYIGLVQRPNASPATNSQPLLKGALQKIDEANRCSLLKRVFNRCPSGQVRFEIKPIVNESDVDQVIAVIGDFNESTPLTSIAYYEERGVPAILTTYSSVGVENSRYAYRIVPDHLTLGTYLANYARRAMRQTNASILYDPTDPDSMMLMRGFESPFISLALSADGSTENVARGVVKKWDIATSHESIYGEMLRLRDAGVIFITVRPEVAESLIIEIRKKGLRNPILAVTDLAAHQFVENVKSSSLEEQSQPGYITDGVYIGAPIIFDGASQEAQNFRTEYLTRNQGEEPTWEAAVAYDGVSLLLQSIYSEGISGRENIEASRASVLSYISSMRDGRDAVEGITGSTFFEGHSAIKPIIIGVYNKQKFVSASIQYYPVIDARMASNLADDRAEGRIISLGGKYYYRTEVIYSGMDFNEISNIDENSSAYQLDFNLWFRYNRNLQSGEDLITAETIQFINNSGDLDVFSLWEERELPGGVVYKLFRVKGTFTSVFDFRNYPFDRQKVEIRFRHGTLTRQNLVFVVDLVGNGDQNQVSKQEFKSGGDWFMPDPRPQYAQNNMVIISSLGNPDLFLKQNASVQFSTFDGYFYIERNLLSFMLRNLLPVLFSIALAYLSFYLPRTEFSSREGVLSGTILSIAFFHLSVSSFLSGIGYTTALDYIFYVFYAIILMGLFTTLLEWFIHTQSEALDEENEELKEEDLEDGVRDDSVRKVMDSNETLISLNEQRGLRLRTFGRISYPAILAGLVVVYFFVYGSPGALVSRIGAMSAGTVSTPVASDAAIPEAEKVHISLGSWRADDEAKVNMILAAFEEKNPDIEVSFVPFVGSQYDAILAQQFKQGNAPDLVYLSPPGGRVFNPESFFNNGYLETLNDIVPGMKDAISEENLKTWQTSKGDIYGVPIYAVSHGIYYNKRIFSELNLKPPTTWRELIILARRIKADNRYIPFANALYEKTDPQRIGDLIFSNLAPSYIGGSAGRLAYEKGERCFNDFHVVRIFQAIQEIAPFMPPNRETISYEESLNLFYSGQAAMWFGGSFDIGKFEANTKDDWGVFAVPPDDNSEPYVTFHVDTAIGLNRNITPEKREAALRLLNSLTTTRLGELIGKYLPGFYPIHRDLQDNASYIEDEKAREFFDLKNGRLTDVRWILPIMGVPDGRSLMQASAFAVVRGENPQTAADWLQNGLAEWYLPAQMCSQE